MALIERNPIVEAWERQYGELLDDMPLAQVCELIQGPYAEFRRQALRKFKPPEVGGTARKYELYRDQLLAVMDRQNKARQKTLLEAEPVPAKSKSYPYV